MPNNNKILQDLFLGFIRVHILFHTSVRPFYGQEIKEELEEHGYSISYGTLYPILKKLFDDGYVKQESKNVNGKIRKYYTITKKGNSILKEAKNKLFELVDEIGEKE